MSKQVDDWRDQVFNDKDLTPHDKVVGYALAALNRELSTIPGQMALAEKAHVSIRAVRNSLHRLVNGGHLKITQTKSGAVRSRYTLVRFPPVRVIVKDGKPVEQ